MICLPCKEAGAYLMLAKQEIPEGGSGQFGLRNATLFHDACESSNCTCQHEVTLDALKAARS